MHSSSPEQKPQDEIQPLEFPDITPLLSALTDPEPDVRKHALRALLQMPLSPDSQRLVSYQVGRMLRDIDSIDAELLAIVAHIPTPEVRELLRGMVDSDRLDVRRAASRALAEVNDSFGARQLGRDLVDPESEIRAQAAASCAKIDLTEATTHRALQRAAEQDDDPDVRLWSSVALARNGETDALEQILEQLDREEIQIPLLWGDPEVVSSRFAELGPWPPPVVEMLKDRADRHSGDAERLAEAILRAFQADEEDSETGPPSEMTLQEFLDRWGPRGEARYVDSSIQPSEAERELTDFVLEVMNAISEAEDYSWHSTEAANDLVSVVSRYQSDFKPDVPRLFKAFEASAEQSNLREQVAWIVSRGDIDQVIGNLSGELRHSDSSMRLEASEFIDLAARYSHEEHPPMFGGGGTAPAHWVEWEATPDDEEFTSSQPPAPVRGSISGSASGQVAVGRDISQAGADPSSPHSATPQSMRSTKVISAWVEERQEETERPLVVGNLYTMSFRIGSPVGGSLLSGSATEVAESDIPPSGLLTNWTVTSDNVELRSISPEVEVRARPESNPDHWTARFGLNVVREDDSDTVQLGIVPRDETDARLRILIDVNRDLWREFSVELAVAPLLEDAGAGGPVTSVVDDTIFVPANQLNPFTWHEWTTPPGKLTLHFRGGGRVDVDGDVWDDGFKPVWEDVSWGGQRANVSNLIRALRSETEKFRAAEQDYLNDIDYDDLIQRLPNFERIYDWNHVPDLSDAAHQAEWDRVASSESLRRVATMGYALYQQCFPQQGEKSLRKWLDGLLPGFQLDIRWTSEDPDWVPHMPWGLMYMRDPALPIDPMYFMGMRFRISYIKRRFSAPRHLGSPDAAFRAHNVYWGTGANDPVAVEASRQADAWSSLSPGVQVRGIPASDNPRADFLSFLADPQPPPMTVLYFFCQCTFNSNGMPELWFGRNENRQDKIDILIDAGGGAFKDRPLVFANACGTASASASEVNELERYFFGRDARAFLGTEALVPIQFASRFASIFFFFFYRLADPAPVAAGEAVTQTRLFLWSQYRNIGGLLYSYVDQFNLYMADSDEISRT